MNMEVFKQYLFWKDKKTDAEREVEEAKERMEFFQGLIMDELVENGVDKVSVDGRLIFPKRQLFASAMSLTDEFRQALADNGATDLVQESINGQRLSAFVREMMRDNGIEEVSGLPDWVKNNVKVSEKVTLGVR